MSARADDDAVVTVVATSLLVAAVVIFVAVFNATFVPVWVADAEAAHAADLRSGMHAWADTAEDHAARDLVGRTFSRTLPVGDEGLPVVGFGATSGLVALDDAPLLEVYDATGGSPDAVASGALSATTAPTRYPAQTYRYALGVLEVAQSEGAWADLRNTLSVERAAGGRLDVAVQAMTLDGAPQEVGSNAEVVVEAEVGDGETLTGGQTDWLRVRATGIEAGAWRAAVERTLGAEGLAKDADGLGCTTSADDYCFDAATNTATTMDLYLRDVKAGWTVTEGNVDVKVRG